MTKLGLKRSTQGVFPSSFLDACSYLQAVYLAAKKKQRSGYSYVRFAEDLGFAATNLLHQIITGRRPLTKKTAARIADGLGLLGEERKYFLGLVALRHAKEGAGPELDRLIQIKMDQLPTAMEKDMLAYYSKWYHSIIREMVRLEDFRSDVDWIISRLRPRLRPTQVRQSLKLLQRLKMIRYDEARGRHVAAHTTISTGHEAYGMALLGFHKEMIDRARHALAQYEPQERDVSVVTMALRRADMVRLKGMIHQFQRELLAVDEACEAPEEVFQVNIQLFPFTK